MKTEQNNEESDISQKICHLNQSSESQQQSEQSPASGKHQAVTEESNKEDETQAFFAGILSADLQRGGQRPINEHQVRGIKQLLQGQSTDGSNTGSKLRFVLRSIEPLSTPPISLEAMGITIGTQKNFNILKYVSGYWFPTCHVDGSLGQVRLLKRSAETFNEGRSGIHAPILGWSNDTERTRPSGFGLQVLRQLQGRLDYHRTPIFICNNELDCLILFQAGFAAVSIMSGERNFDALAQDMKELRVNIACI
jgi:hypothetical protein